MTLPCGSVITGSACDADIWSAHRWRFVGGQLITTEHTGEYERAINAANVLFNVPKSVKVVRKSKNPYDYQRTSLSLTPSTGTNTWLPDGNVTYLITTNGKTVIMDTEDVPNVNRYVFTSHVSSGKVAIYTRSTTDGMSHRYSLYRLILRVPHHSRTTVTYLNGDCFDLRKKNMQLRLHKQDTTNDKPQREHQRT